MEQESIELHNGEQNEPNNSVNDTQISTNSSQSDEFEESANNASDSKIKLTFKKGLQAKRKLQAVSLQKTYMAASLNPKKLKKIADNSTQIKKLNKKEPTPDMKAKAVIEEIELMKQNERLDNLPLLPISLENDKSFGTIYSSSGEGGTVFKKREKLGRNFRKSDRSPTPDVKHKRDKEDKKDRKEDKKDKHKYPNNWGEFIKLNSSFGKRDSKQSTSQSSSHNELLQQLLFKSPPLVIPNASFTTGNGDNRLVPFEFLRYTQASPRISYSINYSRIKRIYLTRKQVLQNTDKKFKSILEEHFASTGRKREANFPPITKRSWYPKSWKIRDGTEGKLIENSIGLSFLQSYSGEEDEEEEPVATPPLIEATKHKESDHILNHAKEKDLHKSDEKSKQSEDEVFSDEDRKKRKKKKRRKDSASDKEKKGKSKNKHKKREDKSKEWEDTEEAEESRKRDKTKRRRASKEDKHEKLIDKESRKSAEKQQDKGDKHDVGRLEKEAQQDQKKHKGDEIPDKLGNQRGFDKELEGQQKEKKQPQCEGGTPEPVQLIAPGKISPQTPEKEEKWETTLRQSLHQDVKQILEENDEYYEELMERLKQEDLKTRLTKEEGNESRLEVEWTKQNTNQNMTSSPHKIENWRSSCFEEAPKKEVAEKLGTGEKFIASETFEIRKKNDVEITEKMKKVESVEAAQELEKTTRNELIKARDKNETFDRAEENEVKVQMRKKAEAEIKDVDSSKLKVRRTETEDATGRDKREIKHEDVAKQKCKDEKETKATSRVEPPDETTKEARRREKRDQTEVEDRKKYDETKTYRKKDDKCTVEHSRRSTTRVTPEKHKELRHGRGVEHRHKDDKEKARDEHRHKDDTQRVDIREREIKTSKAVDRLVLTDKYPDVKHWEKDRLELRRTNETNQETKHWGVGAKEGELKSKHGDSEVRENRFIPRGMKDVDPETKHWEKDRLEQRRTNETNQEAKHWEVGAKDGESRTKHGDPEVRENRFILRGIKDVDSETKHWETDRFTSRDTKEAKHWEDRLGPKVTRETNSEAKHKETHLEPRGTKEVKHREDHLEPKGVNQEGILRPKNSENKDHVEPKGVKEKTAKEAKPEKNNDWEEEEEIVGKEKRGSKERKKDGQKRDKEVKKRDSKLIEREEKRRRKKKMLKRSIRKLGEKVNLEAKSKLLAELAMNSKDDLKKEIKYLENLLQVDSKKRKYVDANDKLKTKKSSKREHAEKLKSKKSPQRKMSYEVQQYVKNKLNFDDFILDDKFLQDKDSSNLPSDLTVPKIEDGLDDLKKIESSKVESPEAAKTPDTEEYRSNWESEDDIPSIDTKEGGNLNTSWESEEEFFSSRYQNKKASGSPTLEMPLNIKTFSRRLCNNWDIKPRTPSPGYLDPNTEILKLHEQMKSLSEERKLLELEKIRIKEMEFRSLHKLEDTGGKLDENFQWDIVGSSTSSRKTRRNRWDSEEKRRKSPVPKKRRNESPTISSTKSPSSSTMSLENQYQEFIKAVSTEDTKDEFFVISSDNDSEDVSFVYSTISSKKSEGKSQSSEVGSSSEAALLDIALEDIALPGETPAPPHVAAPEPTDHPVASAPLGDALTPQCIISEIPQEVVPMPVPSPKLDILPVLPTVGFSLLGDVSLEAISSEEKINVSDEATEVRKPFVFSSMTLPAKKTLLDNSNLKLDDDSNSGDELGLIPKDFKDLEEKAQDDNTKSRSSREEDFKVEKEVSQRQNRDKVPDEKPFKSEEKPRKQIDDKRKRSRSPNDRKAKDKKSSPRRNKTASPKRGRSSSPKRATTSPKRATTSPKRATTSPKRATTSPKRAATKHGTSPRSALRGASPRRKRRVSPRRRRRTPSPRRKRSTTPKRRSTTPKRSVTPKRRSKSPKRRRSSISPRRRNSKRSLSPVSRRSSSYSPMQVLKKSLADSTISDDLLPTPSVESPPYGIEKKLKVEPAMSPKRISLDDRINQALGMNSVKVEPQDYQVPPPGAIPAGVQLPPVQLPPVQLPSAGVRLSPAGVQLPSAGAQLPPAKQLMAAYHQSQHNYEYSQHSTYGYEQFQYCATAQMQYQQFCDRKDAIPAPPTRVVQVGNNLQVVPTENLPSKTELLEQYKHVPKPEIGSKIVQVGNMLQIVPVALPPTTPVIVPPPALIVPPPSLETNSSKSPPPPPAEPQTLPEKKSPEELMIQRISERKAERERRRLEKERRRLEKEKKRKEKVKQKNIKIKMKTENLIKEALQKEIDEVEREEEEDENGEEPPTHWPPGPIVVMQTSTKLPGKGILVNSEVNGSSVGKDRSERKVGKVVQFADGVKPGEGTSPSGGEELSSPPPTKPPKTRKYRKVKIPKKSKKKKIKVKVIKKHQLADSSDEDDNLPPPSPPPGSPPPHLWPPRVKTHHINNLQPNYMTSVVSQPLVLPQQPLNQLHPPIASINQQPSILNQQHITNQQPSVLNQQLLPPTYQSPQIPSYPPQAVSYSSQAVYNRLPPPTVAMSHHPPHFGPPHGPPHHSEHHHGPDHHCPPHHLGPDHHGPPHHHGPEHHGPPHHHGPEHHGPPHHFGPDHHHGPPHHLGPPPPPPHHDPHHHHGPPHH